MTHPLRHVLLAALGAAVLFHVAVPARAGAPMAADTVLELFTSQGCSSCPPADALAGKLIGRSGVILLSLPVDYWDYLGWKDTFAQHAFSERQRLYAQARGDGQVYTPQVVVNGMRHAVGSELDSIEAAIAATKTALRDKQVALKLVPEADGMTVEIGAAPVALGTANATVLLADYTSSADVTIRHGENGGHKVTYYHIVRKLISVGVWTGKAQTIHLSKAAMTAAGSNGCAVLLQSADQGPILAAAQIANW